MVKEESRRKGVSCPHNDDGERVFLAVIRRYQGFPGHRSERGSLLFFKMNPRN